MTPILPTANHEPEKQSSTIFHRDVPGKVVAKFFGEHHVDDANEFCDVQSTPQEAYGVTIDDDLAKAVLYIDGCAELGSVYHGESWKRLVEACQQYRDEN